MVATSMASARLRSELTVLGGIRVYGTIGSGSNSPVRIRTVNMFTRALSMSAIVMRPFS